MNRRRLERQTLSSRKVRYLSVQRFLFAGRPILLRISAPTIARYAVIPLVTEMDESIEKVHLGSERAVILSSLESRTLMGSGLTCMPQAYGSFLSLLPVIVSVGAGMIEFQSPSSDDPSDTSLDLERHRFSPAEFPQCGEDMLFLLETDA